MRWLSAFTTELDAPIPSHRDASQSGGWLFGLDVKTTRRHEETFPGALEGAGASGVSYQMMPRIPDRIRLGEGEKLRLFQRLRPGGLI